MMKKVNYKLLTLIPAGLILIFAMLITTPLWGGLRPVSDKEINGLIELKKKIPELTSHVDLVLKSTYVSSDDCHRMYALALRLTDKSSSTK